MMNTRRQFIAIGLIASGMLLAGCGESDDGGQAWPPFRYRLTVEVDTPQGLRTGSSVIEVRVLKSGKYAIPSPGALSYRGKGQAVAVDLPGGRTLFALLISDSSPDYYKIAPFLVITEQTIQERLASPNPFAIDMERVLTLKGSHEVPRQRPVSGGGTGDMQSGYPMLVTFADNSDPRTIVKVDPDKLAQTFGKGISIKRITVERTDDPVTTGIEKRLKWLPNVYDKLRGSDFKPEGIPVGDFQRLFSTELE